MLRDRLFSPTSDTKSNNIAGEPEKNCDKSIYMFIKWFSVNISRYLTSHTNTDSHNYRCHKCRDWNRARIIEWPINDRQTLGLWGKIEEKTPRFPLKTSQHVRVCECVTIKLISFTFSFYLHKGHSYIEKIWSRHMWRQVAPHICSGPESPLYRVMACALTTLNHCLIHYWFLIKVPKIHMASAPPCHNTLDTVENYILEMTLTFNKELTHRGRVTFICFSKLCFICPDNGSSPIRHKPLYPGHR